tara:strand:- start:132 stop:413 length:282 start_codon:yes stop_codon:yes gene_type:complete
MSFLQSAQVRSALVEIHELQEKIVSNAITFPDLSVEEQYEHIEDLEELLEKQCNMYTRLSLSDDPEAKEMKQGYRRLYGSTRTTTTSRCRRTL